MTAPDTEAGDTPVTPAHVEAFLTWWTQRVRLPTYTGVRDQWCNALSTLTLAELRRGAQEAMKHDPPAYLEPQRFWCVCKGKVSFANALETQRLRRSIGSKQ